ncbi:MAG: hypothetical protein ACK56S_18285 [Planctomycetota bacterium]
MTPSPPAPADATLSAARRAGWWSLAVWLALGLLLEGLHACKLGWYLDVGNDARRLLLTLAHAHGTLLALVQLAVAATMPPEAGVRLRRAGACLRWAGVLMPLGFLAGGVFALGADPGYAIVLVPVGGILLLVGVVAAARVASAPR